MKKGTENGTSSSLYHLGRRIRLFEQEFSVFGVKIGSVEAEAAFTSGFTYETELLHLLARAIHHLRDNLRRGQSGILFHPDGNFTSIPPTSRTEQANTLK